MEIDQAQNLIKSTITLFGNGSRQKPKAKGEKPTYPLPSTPKITALKSFLAQLTPVRTENRRLIASYPAGNSISEINDSLGGYDQGYRCTIALTGAHIVITRNEDVTWSENRNRHWPVSTSTSYVAKLINSHTYDTIKTHRFKTRQGDWLGKLGEALGLPTGARNKITLSGAMMPVAERTRHNILISTLAIFGSGFPTFCATSKGVTYHATSERDAILGLAKKLRQISKTPSRHLSDHETVSIRRAEKLGFCHQGIRTFMSEIGLEDRRSATAGEIRERMRQIDPTPWREELIKIGIINN